VETLRRPAVAKILSTLYKEGGLHAPEIAKKTDIALRHAVRVLPKMEQDGLVKSYFEGNRKYYELTLRGEVLALAMFNLDALVDLYKEEEIARAVRVEAPLLHDFFNSIRSLNARKAEIDKLYAQKKMNGSEYRRQMSEMVDIESALSKKFNRTKSELNREIGGVDVPFVAGFASLESFEDLLRLQSFDEEEELERKIKSLSDRFSSLKQQRETLKLLLKGLEEIHAKQLLDEKEYVRRKNRYVRKLKIIQKGLEKIRELS
jgi:predicted transcriptional regulator